MAPLHLLIKPASGSCNMRCQYCFYADVSSQREMYNLGMLSKENMEKIVDKAVEYATGTLTLAFQGGEPTLAGLDFYRHLASYVKTKNTKNLQIQYAIQTNGMVIDKHWAEFFAENKFLVGISLDGIPKTNDVNRLTHNMTGSFSKIMESIELFKKYNVDFNILTVVTNDTAKEIKRIFNFYKKNKFNWQQYIPCIDDFNMKRGTSKFSLTPEVYEEFLKTRFDLWLSEIESGNIIWDRYFENLMMILKGYMPESCGMSGVCSIQTVIEADGSVYPCDFYVIDQLKLGNIFTDSFSDIDNSRRNIDFYSKSTYVDEKCKQCKWYNLCRGGCRRDREPMTDDRLSLNYFCSSYYGFFEYAYPRLAQLASRI